MSVRFFCYLGNLTVGPRRFVPRPLENGARSMGAAQAVRCLSQAASV